MSSTCTQNNNEIVFYTKKCHLTIATADQSQVDIIQRRGFPTSDGVNYSHQVQAFIYCEV